LTLREVSERSGGSFKPSVVAGYERAERSISLERFWGLCRTYGISPDVLMAEINEAVADDGLP
jgi:transcriptional regulator with XRE-family HTH domain